MMCGYFICELVRKALGMPRDGGNRPGLLRPDRPLGHLAQLPCDRDRLTRQHQPRGLEEDLVLHGTDLTLNDVDREILPTQQAGDAIPDGSRTPMGV
jgi:hypothetical protein